MKKCPNCNELTDDFSNKCDKCGFLFPNDEVNEEKSINPPIDKKENENITSKCENEKKELINKKINKTTIIFAIISVICFIYAVQTQIKYINLSESHKINIAQLGEQKSENQSLKNEKNKLENQIVQLQLEIDELTNGAKNQLSDIKNAFENSEWQTVIDLSSTLHEKYNGSEEDLEAQKLVKTSQENINKQKAAEEAEKAKGYETGITYDQLARTPDQFEDKKVKFYGKVIQVIEDDTFVQIRLAVDDNYDTILFGEYTNSTVSSRVLENDHITIYGTSVGTISYESTLGGTITIPGVYIEKIDQ